MYEYSTVYATNVTPNNIMLSNHKRIHYEGVLCNRVVNNDIPPNLRRYINVYRIESETFRNNVLYKNIYGIADFEGKSNQYSICPMTKDEVFLTQTLSIPSSFGAYKRLGVTTSYVPLILVFAYLYKRWGIESLLLGTQTESAIKHGTEILDKYIEEHKVDFAKYCFNPVA